MEELQPEIIKAVIMIINNRSLITIPPVLVITILVSMVTG